MRIASQGRKVLYVSSEESVMQTKLRADRLGAGSENLFVVSETNLDVIRSYLTEVKPALAVIPLRRPVITCDPDPVFDTTDVSRGTVRT